MNILNKKIRKYLLKCIPVFLLCMVLFTSSVFAFDGLKPWVTPSGNGINRVDNIAGRIWSTIRLVLQIGAFAGIVFTGLRYMFASADAKADMKKSMTTLIIGMIIVFGATTIIDIVVRIVGEAL